MKVTVAALWLTAGGTRKDLSSARYLQSVDPARTFAPADAPMTRSSTITTSEIGGHTVIRCVPHDVSSGRELVYLPGGGYVNPLVSQHWWIIQRLMTGMRTAVTIPMYPLSPEHTVDDARPFIDAAYDAVAARPDTRQIFVAGDSAGGNAALTLVLRLRDSPRRSPDGVILLAPWMDLGLRHPDAWERQRRDPSLRAAGLRAAGEIWAASHSMTDPQISPLYDHGAELPPTLMVQGGRDIFFADTRDFAAKAHSAGSPVRAIFAPDGFHVYPGAYWTPEARFVYETAARFADDPERVARE